MSYVLRVKMCLRAITLECSLNTWLQWLIFSYLWLAWLAPLTLRAWHREQKTWSVTELKAWERWRVPDWSTGFASASWVSGQLQQPLFWFVGAQQPTKFFPHHLSELLSSSSSYSSSSSGTAGPQPIEICCSWSRSSSAHVRENATIECQKECQSICQKECHSHIIPNIIQYIYFQTVCQKLCQNKMSGWGLLKRVICQLWSLQQGAIGINKMYLLNSILDVVFGGALLAAKGCCLIPQASLA